MEKIKQKTRVIIKGLPAILLSVFLVMTVIHAWSGPPGLPPFCPTGDPGCDAPINVSGVTQFKSGALGIGGLFETDGNTYLAKDGGNVGIGTMSPSFPLHVVKDNGIASGIHFIHVARREGTGSDGGVSLGYFADGTSVIGGTVRSTDSLPLFLGTPNKTQAVTILDNGRVGIGNTDPSVALDISGSFRFTGNHLIYNSVNGVINWGSAGSGDLYFRTLSTRGDITTPTERMIILNNGYVGVGTVSPTHILQITAQGRSTSSSWATSSDKRIKENINPISGALDMVMKLKPSTYNYIKDWKKDTKSLQGIQYGFIAQDVEQVLPEMVEKEKEKIGENKIDDFRILSNDAFIPLLVKSVQEQQKIIEKQNKRIEEQNTRIEALEARLNIEQ